MSIIVQPSIAVVCTYHQTVLWCLLKARIKCAQCAPSAVPFPTCTKFEYFTIAVCKRVCYVLREDGERKKKSRTQTAEQHMETSQRDKNMLFVRHFIIFSDSHDLFSFSARHKPKSARWIYVADGTLDKSLVSWIWIDCIIHSYIMRLHAMHSPSQISSVFCCCENWT